MNRPTAAIIAAFVLALVAVVLLESRRDPVVVREAPGGGVAADLGSARERVQLSVAAAVARNDEAARGCEHELDRILDREFAEIERRAGRAAEEVSTYGSCSTLIYTLAKEKLGGATSTADFVEQEIRRRLQPALDTCGRELDSALGRYELALRESTVTLAVELAQASPAAPSQRVDVLVDAGSSGDLDQALVGLGISGGIVTVTGAFDVAAVLNAGVVRGMIRKIAQLAASIFAKPAATAAGSAAVAVADGPLPVGDVIAVLGGVWTGYEVYATRKQFELEIRNSLANALPQMKRDVHRQIMERVRSLRGDYQRAQDRIRNELANSL